MFCETCDTVFCVVCTGGSHNGRGSAAHTVIPFSIAIKRMSEILLYKVRKLLVHQTALFNLCNIALFNALRGFLLFLRLISPI